MSKLKTKFKGIIFTIKQEKKKMPDGKYKIFEYAFRPASVIILAFDDKDKLILTREYRPAYKKWMWRLPGGRVDKEKNPQKAAIRELREETGFKPKKLKLYYKVEQKGSFNWTLYVFIASNLMYAPLPREVDEKIKIFSFSLKKAYKMALERDIEESSIALAIIRLYYDIKNNKIRIS